MVTGMLVLLLLDGLELGFACSVDVRRLCVSPLVLGLAHFIEHMCFNGSENFAPGELIPYFESIGMEFGADANAFTSFDQTGSARPKKWQS